MNRNKNSWRIPEKRISENSTLGKWYDWLLAGVNIVPGLKKTLVTSMLNYMEKDRDRDSSDHPTKPHKVSWERGRHNKYHMLTRIPHWHRTRSDYDATSIRRGNRFLAIQEKRIRKALSEGKMDKATIIWIMTLKLSKSYHVALYNKVAPSWYWKWDSKFALHVLKKFSNKCRNMDFRLSMNRWYLDKDTKQMATQESKRIRPIGAPTMTSRMMSKAINQMVYWLSESNRERSMQHGYRVDLGCFSALMKVREGLLLGMQCYEFDLVGFFNTVPRDEIKRAVKKYCGKLCSDIVDKILIEIRYTFKELLPERELKLYGMKLHGGKEKKVIVRTGIPQGLPLSPVISTLVLEMNGSPRGLTMYADDGLYLYEENKYEFTNWLRKLGAKGIRLSEEKSGDTDNLFKFLGVWFNKKNQECGFEDTEKRMHWIKWENPEIETWFKQVAQWYGKENKEWDWDVHPEAFITRQPLKMSWWEKTISYWTSHLFDSNPFRGYRWLYSYVDINGKRVRWDKLSEHLKRRVIHWGKKFADKEMESPFKMAGEIRPQEGTELISGAFYDIASGSSWSCMKLLEYLKKTKLSKIKAFNLKDIDRRLEPLHLTMYDPLIQKGSYSGEPRFGEPYQNGIMNYKKGYYEIINNGYDDKIAVRYFRHTKLRKKELAFIERTKS